MQKVPERFFGIISAMLSKCLIIHWLQLLRKLDFLIRIILFNEVINLLPIMNSEKFSALLVIDNFDNIFDDNMCRIFAASYLSTAVGLRYAFILKKIN